MRNDAHSDHDSIQSHDGRFPLDPYHRLFFEIFQHEEDKEGNVCQGKGAHLSPEVVADAHVIAQSGESHRQHHRPARIAHGTKGEECQWIGQFIRHLDGSKVKDAQHEKDYADENGRTGEEGFHGMLDLRSGCTFSDTPTFIYRIKNSSCF